MRGRDSVWKIIKYKTDISYYMQCACGFEDRCNTEYIDEDGSWRISDEVFNTYKYCPNCGARKKWITQVDHVDDSPLWTR